jgi:hypothetical protein
MITANLLHLSYNMWRDTNVPEDCPPQNPDVYYSPELRCDRGLWRECLEAMTRHGFDMVVIDLGDGVRYESHPEIAVRGAWSPGELAEELDFCRELGLDPIPKLNFSTCHDAWLGQYSRKVSTGEYYEVCADLIREVCELFDAPRLFHLGMDEENYELQRAYEYVVVRQGDLWWEDLLFFFDEVRDAGSRPWMWSDVLWACGQEEFERHVPRDVMQSNWYYADRFEGEDAPAEVRAFEWLDRMGYEQIPTGSTFAMDENFPLLQEHCRERISEGSLAGFMMADWRPMLPRWRESHLRAIKVGQAD